MNFKVNVFFMSLLFNFNVLADPIGEYLSAINRDSLSKSALQQFKRDNCLSDENILLRFRWVFEKNKDRGQLVKIYNLYASLVLLIVGHGNACADLVKQAKDDVYKGFSSSEDEVKIIQLADEILSYFPYIEVCAYECTDYSTKIPITKKKHVLHTILNETKMSHTRDKTFLLFRKYLGTLTVE